MQLSFDGEKCALLLCAWKLAFLKSGHMWIIYADHMTYKLYYAYEDCVVTLSKMLWINGKLIYRDSELSGVVQLGI